jgi:hypothetical protein
MKGKPRPWLRITLLLLIVGGAYHALRQYELNFIYDPSALLTRTPRDVDLPFDSIVVTASDGANVHGWLIPQEAGEPPAPTNAVAPTLLFLHGSDGNMSDRLQKIRLFHDVGLAVFIIDYRGYGKSAGTPSERGLAEDAFAAYSYLVDSRGMKPDRLYIYGEDLGAAVAIGLAGHVRGAGLILEGASAPVIEKMQEEWPLIPGRYLLQDKFDSLNTIGEVHMPVLFIHSADDEVAPSSDSKRLFALAHQPKEFVGIHGSHRDAFVNSFDTYYEAISHFVHGESRAEPDRPKDAADISSPSTPATEPASKEPSSS